MSRDRSLPLLLLCFFLSGLAALVYETAWTREFAFVFGTSELAVATVLAAYMGGLAAGAALASRYAARIARPVLAYGLLELGIAVAALAVPLGIAASRWLYVALFGGQETLPETGGLATSLFYLACSFAILLVPTAMMGATLPLLARHAVRHESEIGSRVGVLYAVNTAGAVAGVSLGAFVLLPELGLRWTIAAAAGINALVFAAAWALARSTAPLLAAEPETAPAAGAIAGGSAGWILPLIAASGFVSFSYEVLWVRLLSHVVGSGTHAFATMLASFLTGIALGSAVASRLATTPRRAALGFGVSQLGIAGLSLAAFAAVDRLPGLVRDLQLQGSSVTSSHVVACIATLFPSALCIGATFPFAVRILARRGDDAGPASARVYAANTLGSIGGAIGAGFFLVPWLGFAGTLVAGAAVNVALALAAALVFSPRRPGLALAGALGGVALFLLAPGTPWNVLRASSMGLAAGAWGPVTYLGVGRSSTVLVTDQRYAWGLRTNGLPEAGMLRSAGSANRHATTRWLTALPVMARPETRTMLLVGFGGGMALEVVPESVERIDVVELEPEVIEANRRVADGRWRDPLADPRVHVHLNDARNALLLSARPFDAIVSQPSHPWAGGAAHLYTREYFALVRDHLSEDGVFVQWIGLPFVDEALFRSLLATLSDVFPHVQAYSPPPDGSVLFLASKAPLEMTLTVPRAIAAAPDDFALLGIRTPEDVYASQLLDEAAVAAGGAGAPLNRDGHNRLQSRSAGLGEASLIFRGEAFFAPLDPLARRVPPDSNIFYILRRLPPKRAQRVAAGLPDPLVRTIGEAIAEMEAGRRVGPRRKLEEALAEDPRHPEARAAMLQLSASAIAEGADPTGRIAPPLSSEEQALADGWVARAEDPTGAALRALEPELAAVPFDHPLGAAAATLRVQGRLASGDPASIAQAIRIADATLGDRPDTGSVLLRAETLAAAGEHAAVLETLGEVTQRLDPSVGASRAHARRALELARATPDTPDLRLLRNLTLRLLGGSPGPRGGRTTSGNETTADVAGTPGDGPAS